MSRAAAAAARRAGDSKPVLQRSFFLAKRGVLPLKPVRLATPLPPPLLRAPRIEVAENGTMATSIRAVEPYWPAARMLSPSYAECPRRLCGECAE